MTKGAQMTTTTKVCRGWVIAGPLAALGFTLAVPQAWALGPGAPPVIKFANVEVVATDGGTPRLVAYVSVEIPGGNVPLNVASVTVTLPPPDGRTFTLPLDRVDLVDERGYNLDAVVSPFPDGTFPAGTYTFTVTDTAGGISIATDDLALTTGLPSATNPSVSGAIPVSGQPSHPPTVLLNLTLNPTPTISWIPAPGAVNQRVRVRGGLQDLDLFSRYTGDGTTASMTLPAGVMVPGRRYLVRLDSYDNVNGAGCSIAPFTCQDSNARSRRRIEIITQGPEIFLTFGTAINGRINYSAGQTLDVTARIYNTGPTVMVNAYAWIGLPTAAVIPILNMPDLTIPNSTANPTGPNDFYSGPIGFSYTFNGSEPSGNYIVGLRLTDPATDETVALATRAFAK